MHKDTSELCDRAQVLRTGDRKSGRGLPRALSQLNEILPRLHAAMTAVGHRPTTGRFDPSVDLDKRFELFSRLHGLLGDLDGYWMEYDVTPDRQEMSGSLADDLTDIYCELKHGLTRLERYDDAPHARRVANRIL